MPVSYRKLFELMEIKGVKKFDLRKMGISPTIVARLVKNTDVNMSTIAKLCELLECQPGDLVEYIPDKEDGATR
ncbi:helix-turn-helix transcriptional regulator [Hydrogenoanaerobacterium sp.]|uniref:helix-turn-helix domain-containing protein n=1 Tax=Hydrogenoanaerobacterium sp. TaxID=2953763 RepID=UPI00289F69CA|nr:helix-turn-helix transcriptional regulator [Hydrogenoanaerobacterium sp.]